MSKLISEVNRDGIERMVKLILKRPQGKNSLLRNRNTFMLINYPEQSDKNFTKTSIVDDDRK